MACGLVRFDLAVVTTKGDASNQIEFRHVVSASVRSRFSSEE